MQYYLAFIEFGFPMVCKILQILVRVISRARMALLRELHNYSYDTKADFKNCFTVNSRLADTSL